MATANALSSASVLCFSRQEKLSGGSQKKGQRETGGLLTRIEGLRGVIPKQELVKRVNSFTELKENVIDKQRIMCRKKTNRES